jgi:DNA-directed RNA polymerase subunit K/omega
VKDQLWAEQPKGSRYSKDSAALAYARQLNYVGTEEMFTGNS